MSEPVCLRCDWTGETHVATCPKCGAALYRLRESTERRDAALPRPQPHPARRPMPSPAETARHDESIPPAAPVAGRWRAAVIVGVLTVAAIGVVMTVWSSDRTQKPANEPSGVNSTDAAEEVARGFIAAFGAFDAEAAMTYLADDADVRWLIDQPAPANERGLSLELALLEAQRFQLTITSCQAVPFGSATSVICGFDFNAIASDVLGLGPFTGSTFVFTVRDGEIVKAAINGNLDQFAPQMRAPFAKWVASTYPKDFRVMYNPSLAVVPHPWGYRQVSGRPTEESIQLWEQHTREYVVKAVTQGFA